MTDAAICTGTTNRTCKQLVVKSHAYLTRQWKHAKHTLEEKKPRRQNGHQLIAIAKKRRNAATKDLAQYRRHSQSTGMLTRASTHDRF